MIDLFKLVLSTSQNLGGLKKTLSPSLGGKENFLEKMKYVQYYALKPKFLLLFSNIKYIIYKLAYKIALLCIFMAFIFKHLDFVCGQFQGYSVLKELEAAIAHISLIFAVRKEK